MLRDPHAAVGIYVHLPFCRVRCSYCAFAVSTDLRLEDAYGEALLAEIGLRAAPRREAVSLFWGGGTPSRSAHAWVERIDAEIRARFDLAADAEVTLEANPEDVGEEALERWKARGVNRISIGVQSFHDAELIPLGRVHGRRRALDAAALATASGLRTSLDLILGLPGQTPESFRETLDLAIGTGVGHLSVYMLDLEPGSALESRLARGLVTLPPDETVAAIYLEAVDRLRGAGFAQYEVSNFARQYEVSRHNLRYWERAPYLGFGAGAHSFEGDVRRGNTKDVRRYIERLAKGEDPVEMTETLGPGEERRERLFLALRQARGIEYARLLEWSEGKGEAWCERGLSEGWITSAEGRVAFTPRGFLVSSELLAALF
ncbi:MAG: radical SAM family heme chaperone HemW [Thermoanaerobaculia bacterium]